MSDALSSANIASAATALLALTVAACEPSPTNVAPEDEPPQLLANIDMEGGQTLPDAWSTGGVTGPPTGYALEWSDQHAASGQRSLGIRSATSAPAASGAFWSQTVSVVDPVRATFLLKASVKLDQVTGAGVAIAIRGDNTSLNNCCAEAFVTTQGLHTITGTRGWTPVEVGLSGVPTDVDRITVYLLQLSNTSGTVYFDDVTLSVLNSTGGMARVYFDRALALMQANSIKRYEIDWAAFRQQAWRDVAGAQVPSHTYRPIRLALVRIGDNHSGLILPPASPLPSGPFPTPYASPPAAADPAATLLEGDLGYVEVPAFSGSGLPAFQLATSYHALIQGVDTLGTCGWVVDLRGNTGGNMWPMVAGIGPVLGEGIAGFFVNPDGVTSSWFYRAGSSGIETTAIVSVSPYVLRSQNPPVAVLTDSLTASSGEATTIAFRGRPGARSFGTPTRGLSTANQGFPLSDGAILNLTVSTMADRTGQLYGLKVTPDEIVPGAKTRDPATDPPLRAAVDWLHAQPACAGP